MPKTATSTAPIDELLEWGCARNVAAELHYETSNGALVTGRVRLMEVNGRLVMIERPPYMNDEEPARVGKPVTIHVSLRGARLQFKSVIEDANCRIRLNRNNRVDGLALRKPSLLEPSQRRTDVRISVLGFDPISVSLVRPHPTHPCACPVDAPILATCLLDLSVGGVSVLIDRAVLASVTPGERFFLSFGLPEIAEPFDFLSAVRHKRLIDSSDSLRVGLALVPWPGATNASEQRRISHFIAAYERRMLRRRR